MDERTPVIVGAAQLNGGEADNEPVAMMVDAASAAMAGGHPTLDTIRVVKGVWPYADPGRLVGERLGWSGPTGITQLSGNEAFDLVNQTALEIQRGSIDGALIFSAETMRTRRRDKRAGRKSPYLPESHGAFPDQEFGSDTEFWEDADWTAWGLEAVNFYAMAASAVRHRMGLTPDQYLQHTGAQWSAASRVAASNPTAAVPRFHSAEDITTPSEHNRLVAAPFTKLMTSNINVDMAAAVVMCSVGAARSAGIDPGSWVFPSAGSGGFDPLLARTRHSFAESPSMRIAGQRALELAGITLADIEHLDLYSCFPSAVQVAQHELDLPSDRPFTITGGMTFAGGPFNSYCLHSLVAGVERLRQSPSTAFLTGNGGWLTKHSFLVLSSRPPAGPFRYERPQTDIDAESRRQPMESAPTRATIDAYTVKYGRSGEPDGAVLAVADAAGDRAWATSNDDQLVDALLNRDLVGAEVGVTGRLPVLTAVL